ncbi:MAG: NADH-quinone oxidoreductase subunit J [Candidatus Hydrogenedentes bacterium]|nr:NADH-quinone oxidoreductase subunit J [Candidatus Hydrogenedentota bacterium]
MTAVFYVASLIAIVATGMVITRFNAVHSLLYLIVSLMAVALVFVALGAYLAAVLEIIIYAGAIMVLFIFVVMMLNQGPESTRQERLWLTGRMWVGPGLLALILSAELIYALGSNSAHLSKGAVAEPKDVSLSLFGPYFLVVELASILLLAGIIGAFCLGRREYLGKEAPKS